MFIEMLVTISLLATLAAIVVLNLVGLTNRGAGAACETDVKTIESAMTAYYDDNNRNWNGNFPGSAGGTVYNNNGNTSDAFPVFDPLRPTFVHSIPFSCFSVTITDVAGGSKIVSGTP
jgi:type II secretory pathway pseudopilin PulG